MEAEMQAKEEEAHNNRKSKGKSKDEAEGKIEGEGEVALGKGKRKMEESLRAEKVKGNGKRKMDEENRKKVPDIKINIDPPHTVNSSQTPPRAHGPASVSHVGTISQADYEYYTKGVFL
ncbi:uncharacterized protein [Henckelia pumila]|uniref:uncharacterized protein n=1 Tax=Henckelia pumila TaxID=405737 RepID=UPI003C6E7C3C